MLRRDFLIQSAACSAGFSALASAKLMGAEPSPLRVMFYGGSLPSVRSELEKRVKLQVLVAGQDPKKQGNAEDNVIGLEQLKEADLWIGSANKRNFPGPAQLSHFQDYLAAGKPFVGYRAASHIFQNWLEVDQTVWGAKYGGHHLLNKDPELIVELAPKAAEHPILKDLKPPAPRSGSYYYRELAGDVQVLLFSGLQGDMQPHTWTRIVKGSGNRVFYTRYDAKQIAENEVCREIFLRGIVWAVGGSWDKFQKA